MDPSQFEEWENTVTEATDEFCKSFVNERAFYGPFAVAVGHGSLPQGVDPHDARVLELRRKCRERAAGDPELPFTD